jgi:hypothetical protein
MIELLPFKRPGKILVNTFTGQPQVSGNQIDSKIPLSQRGQGGFFQGF